MPNQIASAENYVAKLDKKYTQETKTNVLDSQVEVEYNRKTKKFDVGRFEVDGLGNYDRTAEAGTNAYAGGTATLVWDSYEPDYERSKRIRIDTIDDQDAQFLAFANVAATLIEDHAGPELDAYRYARYASAEGITKVEENLEDATATLKSLRKASTTMNQNNVKENNRYLFIDHDYYDNIEDLDTTKSKKVLDRFTKVIPVTSNLFMDKITLNTGKDGVYGYSRPEDAKRINFMIVQKDAVMQFIRHKAPKEVSESVNQLADANEWLYRIQALCNVYKNKTKGIYVSVQGAEG